MSKNVKPQTSASYMQWKYRLVLLTGGIVSGGAIGWLMYKGYKSQQFDYKAIKTIAAAFAGGVGICFTSSALIYMYGKPNDGKVKSITCKKDALDQIVLDNENSLRERFLYVVNELDREFAVGAKNAWECKNMNTRTPIDNTQEEVEVPCKLEDMTERLLFFNRKGPWSELKLPTDKKMETFPNKGVESWKTKFREEILSYTNELKGYLQGIIDPFPSARNIQFRSTEMSDETRRQVVMIVREYLNSMLPKLQQTIDEFVDSVYKAVKVPDYDKEHKVKKAMETMGMSENDLSTELKKEMKQYYNTLENVTRNKPQMPSCQNGQQFKDVLGANMHPLESDNTNKAVKVLDYDKEQKVKKAMEILGMSENDLSTKRKNERKQYYNTLENTTRSKPQMNLWQNGQWVLVDNMHPLESSPSPPLQQQNIWTKASECSFPVIPKLATPTSADISFMSKAVNNSDRHAVERPKTPLKLSLNQEQMNFLNLLKSEL